MLQRVGDGAYVGDGAAGMAALCDRAVEAATRALASSQEAAVLIKVMGEQLHDPLTGPVPSLVFLCRQSERVLAASEQLLREVLHLRGS